MLVKGDEAALRLHPGAADRFIKVMHVSAEGTACGGATAHVGAARSAGCRSAETLGSHQPAGAAASSSKIATARVNPAEAALILKGKQATWNPVGGSWSRLASFSIWQ